MVFQQIYYNLESMLQKIW